MKRTRIHITIIHSQKLQNIVGQGSASPYQIWTSTGNFLGELGKIVSTSEIIASNDDDLLTLSPHRQSWMQRIRASFGLK